jgi:hypothetical protein
LVDGELSRQITVGSSSRVRVSSMPSSYCTPRLPAAAHSRDSTKVFRFRWRGSGAYGMHPALGWHA